MSSDVFSKDEQVFIRPDSARTNGKRMILAGNITDPKGASIVRVDQSFSRLDDLVALIASHVDSKGDDTAGRVLRKKARKQAVALFVIGAFMTFACGFVAWKTYENQRATRMLKERGQPGEAEIVRRFVAPNGVTKRIEYRVAGAGDTRNAEVNPEYWERLEGAKSVPVIFVADEPDVSRLTTGEVVERDFTKTPAGGYLLATLGGAMAVFMLAATPFAWNGLDLSFDQTTKKWCLKRYGKVVWSSKGGGKQININEYLSKG